MRLAVIGDPIAHSLSPAIHTAVFDELGIPLIYSAHRVEKGRLDEFMPLITDEGIDGFNVTMPHKLDIMRYCQVQRRPGTSVPYKAVNTVRLEQNGSLSGFSTDEDGFLLSLRERGFDPAGKTIVIAGRGGVTATLSSALAAEHANVSCISVREGVSLPDGADLFVNATPLGMEGQDWACLGFLKKLPRHALVYDLLYNPPQTALLRQAAALGLQTVNGLDMLVYQAILSDSIYLRRELDTALLKKAVMRKL